MEVKVLMTSSAKDFVAPLSFSVLSDKPVDSDISDGEVWNNHVESGLWADAMVIAPCTANTIAKMAHGIADNILLATYLSARCPVIISPAMDVDMYHHPATQKNLTILKEYGVQIIPVDYGELASGLVGEGRMAEPEAIFSYVSDVLEGKSGPDRALSGKTVMITAGPTQEPIDPVRYIGNRSSGKMGIALAEECVARGAKVDLVLGPTHLECTSAHVTVHRVSSAADMMAACDQLFNQADIAVMAAAVADYKPVHQADHKIKKCDEDKLQVTLVETQDIAAALGRKKRSDQILIGFALETNNEIQFAEGKLKKKNFDFIVLNSLQDKGAGFAHDTNKVTIIHEDMSQKEFGLKLKSEVARDIVDEIVGLTKNK